MQLLFGIRASSSVTLTVTATGDLPTKLPDLQIKTAKEDKPFAFSSGTWVANLDVGDSIVYVPSQGEGCLLAQLTFTLSASATIITASSADGSLISWTGTAGVTIGPRDVKNPWPPPSGAQTTPLADAGWIGSALGEMGAQADSSRSPSSQVPPARTGRQDHHR